MDKETNKAYRQNIENSTKFINDSIGLTDLDKAATIDALREKYHEIESERKQLTDISISAAVKAERLRIARIVMAQEFNDNDDLIHKILYP